MRPLSIREASPDWVERGSFQRLWILHASRV